ncbi:hypothetical protein GGI42DRAFT_112930 [Trichoderma sp. SZMC 28013]
MGNYTAASRSMPDATYWELEHQNTPFYKMRSMKQPYINFSSIPSHFGLCLILFPLFYCFLMNNNNCSPRQFTITNEPVDCSQYTRRGRRSNGVFAKAAFAPTFFSLLFFSHRTLLGPFICLFLYFSSSKFNSSSIFAPLVKAGTASIGLQPCLSARLIGPNRGPAQVQVRSSNPP